MERVFYVLVNESITGGTDKHVNIIDIYRNKTDAIAEFEKVKDTIKADIKNHNEDGWCIKEFENFFTAYIDGQGNSNHKNLFIKDVKIKRKEN